MDVTLQGHAMQAGRAKPKGSWWSVTGFPQLADFAKKSGVISAIALFWAFMYPQMRREDREYQARREDAQAAQQAQVLRDVAADGAKAAADHRAAVEEIKEWSREQTTLLIDAMSRSAQKMDDSSKVFKGAADTVKGAAEKIEAATGNVQ